jgi:hypothetical protein
MIRDELEGMYSCTCIDAYKNRDMVDPSCWGCEFKSAIPDILAITNPPLTVWLPCDKCGGSGKVRREYCPKPYCMYCHIPEERMIDKYCPEVLCTCTDGKVEREIEWHVEIDMGAQLPDGTWATEHDSKTLHLHDLKDPDVVYAYTALLAKINIFNKPVDFTIPNNKGTLRIKEAK